eukprot:CAMPEP_0179036582 /NCGR_PEP_ID=MMETSP0796-20121207/13691_1 /TAXON_ID=73915 /ORGANISM="Pyrodinium bahamense, Strain pbaha01" /LENGTH=241 /DNA_ID=CAMNT_0020732871 /DNA_START=60 /DNA_END=785 /DNA_ORIENTATION=-
MSPKASAMKRPAASASHAPSEEAQEDAGPSEVPAPGAAGPAEPPSVSVEYFGGQRWYTAWAQIPGTCRRVLAPARPNHERADSDAALVKQLSEKPWAGEAIAGRWRRGELDDKQAAKELREAPEQQPAQGVGGRGRVRGRGGGRGRSRGGDPGEEGDAAEAGPEAEAVEDEGEGPDEAPLPPASAQGRSGRGRGRGVEAAAVLKRPAGQGGAVDSRVSKKRAQYAGIDGGASSVAGMLGGA